MLSDKTVEQRNLGLIPTRYNSESDEVSFEISAHIMLIYARLETIYLIHIEVYLDLAYPPLEGRLNVFCNVRA